MTTAKKIAAQLGQRLKDDWSSHARPEQLPPAGDSWSIWLYLGGRGTGKTRSGVEYILSQKDTHGRIALVAPTASDARDVLCEGPSGIMSCCPDWDRPVYEPSKRRITWKNGAVASIFSAEEPDRLRGPQHELCLCDELAAWANVQHTWDMMMFGLRMGRRPRVCVTTTPRPTKIIRDLVGREGKDVVITRGRTADNAANLAPQFLTTIVNRYAGTRLGRQELDAEVLTDIEGALWNLDLIESCRVEHAPALRRIVIGVDPAASTGENSDETGIVVAGLGTDGHAYVLEDLTGRYSPIMWANRVVAAYKRHRADRVVAESNMGGQMVEATLRSVDRNIAFTPVHATKAKVVRAEPISALYEKGMVHHVGSNFVALEDQMVTYEPGSTDSPDHLDAAIWCLTALMIGHDTPINYTMPAIVRSPAFGVDILPQVVRDPGSAEHPLQAHGPAYSGSAIPAMGLPSHLKGF